MEVFKFKKCEINDLVVVETKIYNDDRGYLFESWNNNIFESNGIKTNFVQDKVSYSKKGVLRGLHFQEVNSQAKFVRVLYGKAFDVAVDLRKDSTTFGKKYCIEISEENKLGLYIPENFAHGYLTLSDELVFLYKTSNYYFPEYDKGIVWDDQDINIQWPFEKYGIEEPVLSEKDRNLPTFSEWRMANGL